MTERKKCFICGEIIKRDERIASKSGWLSSMAGVEGTAHYSCAARLANERAYEMESPPWDIGKPHLELVKLVDEGKMKLGRVLIPGVGLGHSALFLAEKGFEVTAVDISQKAIARLVRKAKARHVNIQTIVGDFLSKKTLPSTKYDYVFERAFLQTLPFDIRHEYFQIVRSALRSEGMYIGIIRGPRTPPATSQPYSFRRSDLVELIKPFFDSYDISKTVSGHGDETRSYWLVMAQVRES